MRVKPLFFFAVLFMLGLSTLAPSASFAQRYPDHPIQFVIPNVAGSSMDNAARIFADELEKSLGAKIIPINKPGASTVLGTDFAVRAKEDGYTLLYAGLSSLVIAPAINPELVHYDPSKDVESLGFHFLIPTGINIKSDSHWKTFGELIDSAKKNPGKLRVATSGVGSLPQFIVEMIQAMTGAHFT